MLRKTQDPILGLTRQILDRAPWTLAAAISLKHDLDLHWHWTARTTLTFRYLNNITHQGNTADMGLGASLTAHF